MGFLGSFSTFSTFVYDLFDLIVQLKFNSAFKMLIISFGLDLLNATLVLLCPYLPLLLLVSFLVRV